MGLVADRHDDTVGDLGRGRRLITTRRQNKYDAATTQHFSARGVHCLDMRSDHLRLGAEEAVEALRSGRLRAEDYLRTLLDVASQRSHLNSLIALNPRALDAARHIDALVARKAALPPLAGLPIVIKDSIDFAGMATTGGTPALRNLQPKTTAPALQRLLDAGVIVLGKANMHELALGVTNTNLTPFAGVARNPLDPTRVPGGSSGGTAVAIAAGIVPAGLGTDTGGSVRIPASFCGLAGLRPSVGNGGADRRYPGSGVLPISHTRDTIGPMARNLHDVALLDAILGAVPAAEPLTLEGVRLGLPVDFWAELDSGVAAVMHHALDALRAAGVVLVEVDMEDLGSLAHQAGFAIALHEIGVDIPAYLAAHGREDISLAGTAAQVASPDVRRTMSAVLRKDLAPQYELAMTRQRPRMQAIYARCFDAQRLDALVFPTIAVPPPLIDTVNGSPLVAVNDGPKQDFFALGIRNTDPGSTAGMPGITIPAGRSASGLPVGMALDGPIGSDARLLGLGMGIESVLG